MRSILTMAAPLNVNGIRYDSKNDRESEQEEYAEEFILDTNNSIQENYGNDDSGFRVELLARPIS